MRILITGGSGFIGRNLLEQYAGRYDVLAPSRAELDLLDASAVRAYLERHRFDAVIHAATVRSNRRLGAPPHLMPHNCRMFFNLARNTSAFGRLLFLSSGAVYDRAQPLPRVSEDFFDCHVPAGDYGLSKYVCAKAVDVMDRVFELRLFGVFGPHEDWRVRFLSNACCRAVWDLPVVIRQNANFDYLDVTDLGRILERFLVKILRHRHYNISSGRAVELKTLAGMVVRASGKKLEIVVRREEMGADYCGDNSRMLAEIPDFETSGMADSIRRLYAWYEGRKASIDPAALEFDG
jgi:GDP-L-fucose synthase